MNDATALRVSWFASWPRRLPVFADHYRHWCLAGAFLLLIIGFNGQWRPGPDSAIYSTIARHLAEGRGFTHPMGLEGVASPGLPYLIAATFRLFGADVMWPAVTLMFLFAAGTLALTYLWMRLHARRGVAVIVTVLLAINSTFYRYSLDVLTDIPFLFGVMLLLVGHELTERADRREVMGWILIATGMGVMAAFRLVFVVVAGALMVTLLVKAIRQRQWRRLAAAVLVLAIPVLIRELDPRSTDSTGLVKKESEIVHRLVTTLPDMLRRAVMENLPDLLSDIAPTAMLGNQIDGQGIILDGVITIVAFTAGLMLIRRRMLWGLMVLFFLIQWLLFLPDVRYFLPILPILIYGWWRFSCWVALVMMPDRMGRFLASFLLVLYVGMNLGRAVGFVIEQRSVPLMVHYRRGHYEGVTELGHELRRLTAPDAWVVTPEKWLAIMTFASDRRTASGPWQPLPPDQNAANVYVVEPADESTRQMIKSRGWELGEPICSFTRRTDATALTVHRVRARPNAEP